MMLLDRLDQVLWQHWRPVFSQTRTFVRAKAVLVGLLSTYGRRTVSRALCAEGRAQADWAADYRTFSRSPWKVDELFAGVVAATLPHLPEEGFITAASKTPWHFRTWVSKRSRECARRSIGRVLQPASSWGPLTAVTRIDGCFAIYPTGSICSAAHARILSCSTRRRQAGDASTVTGFRQQALYQDDRAIQAIALLRGSCLQLTKNMRQHIARL